MIKALLFTCLLLPFTTLLYSQIKSPAASDSEKVIQILRGNHLHEITIDSVTRLESISGSVSLRQGKTIFSCDSVVLNSNLNTIEAFGNVHINDADTLNTYSQYLKYVGNERKAYLKKNVRLSDRKGTLTTNEMEYDLRSGIGVYKNGGRVVNGKTILTSDEGTYYSDLKEVYFRHNVKVTGPKNITADSLIYNTQTEIVNFTGPTKITSKEANIFTTQGSYELRSGNAFFVTRTSIRDSSGRFYQADKIAMQGDIAQMEGNAIVKDSANGIIVLGNQIFLNRKNNSFQATRKPVLIIKQEKDSTYISADTLFSGFLKMIKPLHGKDSTLRFFQAFHHVRIFNDSLQSVCDSLFYSDEDSLFRLFHDPVIWSAKSQVTGDTIYLFTKNKKAERLYVFNSGMIINKAKGGYYNQMAGKTINGYLKDGSINYVRVKGTPAESIYYVQDSDSAFVGMNRATADVIDLYFIKEELNKVKFVNDVKGRMHPIRLIPEDQKFLNNFKWQDKRRPKNKLELFE